MKSPFLVVPLVALSLFSCTGKDPRREATVPNLQAALTTFLKATPLRDCRRLSTVELLPTRLVKSQVEPETIEKLRTLEAAGLVTVRDATGPLGPVYAADFTPAGQRELGRGQVCFGPLTLVAVEAVEPAGGSGGQDMVRIRASVAPGNLPAWAKDPGVREALGLDIADPSAARSRTFLGVLTDQGWKVQP